MTSFKPSSKELKHRKLNRKNKFSFERNVTERLEQLSCKANIQYLLLDDSNHIGVSLLFLCMCKYT